MSDKPTCTPLPGNWWDWCLDFHVTHREQYMEGRETCKEVDNDMSKCINPYPPNTYENSAWTRGWNSYWDPKWRR